LAYVDKKNQDMKIAVYDLVVVHLISPVLELVMAYSSKIKTNVTYTFGGDDLIKRS